MFAFGIDLLTQPGMVDEMAAEDGRVSEFTVNVL